jgi:phosphoglucan,water dikinase
MDRLVTSNWRTSQFTCAFCPLDRIRAPKMGGTFVRREQLGKLSNRKNGQVLRRIYASLPSSARDFQRAEPLTRIRDIAHRNDIPSELKREIKTTLQNKLHRCAGPEDLATSTALLERITAPEANYSAGFVEQFRIFHEELKEFFNARPLDDQLKALRSPADGQQAELIDAFLQQRANTGFSEQLSALEALTQVRDSFVSALQKSANGNKQQFILADIGLEDFAFVLVSQMMNQFEAAEPRRGAVDLLKPLGLVIHNLQLSAISTDECGVILAELNDWTRDFDSGDREQLLRLKATIERARRLAESYSDDVIGSLLMRAEQLGRALGVEEHATRVFCEAEIRSHLTFQLSKMSSVLLRRLREALNLPGWDVLVGGEASGRVKLLEKLGDLPENGAELVIAVLKKADGDEEIPRIVKGILVAHEIPHLSHLGVRARQAGVVFVGTDERANLDELEKLSGQTIRLEAGPEKVQWEVAPRIGQDRNPGPGAEQRIEQRKITPVVPSEGSPSILSLDGVTAETAGQKAFGLRKLTELASKSDAEFSVPSALVIPFGAMERMLASAAKLGAEYHRLAEQLKGIAREKVGPITDELRKLVEQLPVSDEITSAIAKTFPKDQRLMVRSSANCEDLEDFAGAGLYESIPNVALKDVASAVRRVWASLWTLRAVVSRNQAAIPHESAQMAVIVQQMVEPDYSFILHTVNPVTRSQEEVYVELAVGLGETLASASARGTPYRLICNKTSGEVQTLAFANFSHALRADSSAGAKRELLDYSQVALSRDAGKRQELGGRFVAIGKRIEEAFQKPQDIEGAVVAEKIYLVQSRAQQGL